MDVARFASNSLTPKIEINIIGGTEINSVTIHPVRFYPQKALVISADRKTLTFEMVKDLPYAIVIINGDDPQDASTTNPQLTLINDPLEEPAKQPSLSAPNVLNFKTFSENYLRKNPNTDSVGQICRPAGSVTDASLNDGRLFTWNHEAGRFVSYTSKRVAFPNLEQETTTTSLMHYKRLWKKSKIHPNSIHYTSPPVSISGRDLKYTTGTETPTMVENLFSFIPTKMHS